VLVDNNTWNNTHIATVGKVGAVAVRWHNHARAAVLMALCELVRLWLERRKAMSCREEVSYQVMRKLDVDYVLVIFGGLIGYSGDDINKFLWMIRIGQGVYPNDIKESNFFTPRGEYKVDRDATPTMYESLMYKLSYYRFKVRRRDEDHHKCAQGADLRTDADRLARPVAGNGWRPRGRCDGLCAPRGDHARHQARHRRGGLYVTQLDRPHLQGTHCANLNQPHKRGVGLTQRTLLRLLCTNTG